jgi:hypothetical protein
MIFRKIYLFLLLSTCSQFCFAQMRFVGDYNQRLHSVADSFAQISIESPDTLKLLEMSQGQTKVLESLLAIEDSKTTQTGVAILRVLKEVDELKKVSSQDFILSTSFIIDKIQQFQTEPSPKTLSLLKDEISFLLKVIPENVMTQEPQYTNVLPEGINFQSANSLKEVFDVFSSYRKMLSPGTRVNFFFTAYDNLLTSDYFSQKEALFLLVLSESKAKLANQTKEIQRLYLQRLGDSSYATPIQGQTKKTSPLAIYVYAYDKVRNSLASVVDSRQKYDSLNTGYFDLRFLEERIEREANSYLTAVKAHNEIPTFGKMGFISLPVFTNLDGDALKQMDNDYFQTIKAILHYTSRGVRVSDPQRIPPAAKATIVCLNLFGTIYAYQDEFEKLRSLVRGHSILELAVGNKLETLLDKAMLPGAVSARIKDTIKLNADPLVTTARIELAHLLTAPTEILDGYIQQYRHIKPENRSRLFPLPFTPMGSFRGQVL